ncbi:S-adenosyl-L-methionine-dependent tRNA 4-demethylwyosine synthase TYW1-like isoform X2 [Hemicordylus capensis]|uniref:S-adenosyl-L-methionine-dependent tRNA 4-demethylwyosine synthase TYW1-like isoform X2 n=1 Tax=Hemicordylus capensis TaxID=884348 RepID=UPI0023033211|nr:S-adenosyl-L-methionine-dependent tRNA 4-demethylwyosine synthase TYW1-like isoform X2 [Hemicordylus capensis]
MRGGWLDLFIRSSRGDPPKFSPAVLIESNSHRCATLGFSRPASPATRASESSRMRVDASAELWDVLCAPLMSLWLNRFYVYTCAAFGISLWICLQFLSKAKKHNADHLPKLSLPKITTDECAREKKDLQAGKIHVAGVKIFYGSQTGMAKRFARLLAEASASLLLPTEVIDMGDYDPYDSLVEETTSKNICVFLAATYTGSKPTENAAWFCKWLEEVASDFRVGKTYLKGLRYAVFGLGNSLYADHYNTVGCNIDKWLWQLGAARILSCARGDGNVAKSRHGSLEADFEAWMAKFLAWLRILCKGAKNACCRNCKARKCRSKGKADSETPEREGKASEDETGAGGASTEQEEGLFETTSEEESGDKGEGGRNPVVDVEDLGNVVGHVKKAKRECELSEEATRRGMGEEERREIITPALREALSKQGYRLIGSHSGVKLCRWTKSMLRGRGGCYKHTFYGIESHRCMETTPSLACANKCVFCWRHHTNPVGTEWRWKMDQPERILQEAVENHQNLIKEFKGVPGVRSNRFQEGMVPKHCALSLVGEPIMYPEIIFLQHQRTVYRLTLVKAWNVEELQAYAELVALSQPDFIEVKGVTYCGESLASNLTMANVPWHEEVVHFVQELVDLLPGYQIACEHEHSICLLIAHEKFKIGGQWHTWIDYGRFQDLVHAYERSGGVMRFTSADYTALTPQWALFGARERGFDPTDTRFQCRNRSKDISGC